MSTIVVDSSIPSAEDKLRYDSARKELIQALGRKRTIDKQLAQLEMQIYNFEGSYLTETSLHSGGNIIQGFDSYLKTQSGASNRRRHEITDGDRMFSNSSLSYQKSIELLSEEAMDEHPHSMIPPSVIAAASSFNNRSSTPGSRGQTPAPTSLTTVVLPPAQISLPSSTPTQAREMTAAQYKKVRDKEYQRRKRADAAARKRELSTVNGTSNSHSEEGENSAPSQTTTSGRRPNKRSRPDED